METLRFMNKCPGGLIYFIMCMVCRGVSGLGASMGLSYAIVGYFFPNRIASVVVSTSFIRFYSANFLAI